jgi:hypothetical protein
VSEHQKQTEKNGEGIEAWSAEQANFDGDVQYDLPWSFT